MSHPPGLLRARRKRPRRPCASNQRDERTASFHTSPAAVGDAAYRRTGRHTQASNRGSGGQYLRWVIKRLADRVSCTAGFRP